jgi:hypothetical protein
LGRLTPKLMSRPMVRYLPDVILMVLSYMLSLADLLRIVLKWSVRVKSILKLQFPVFSRDDPQLWRSRCENYFDMY